MRYFEDLQPGLTVDLGSYHPLTAEEIIGFARQWDPQPFHLDPVLAQDSLFGELVASGWHTAVIGMRLTVEHVLNDLAGQGSPGLENLRFIKPVRPGDSISGRYTVLEVEPSASRPALGKVRSKVELRNQHGDLVLSWDSWAFVKRRPR